MGPDTGALQSEGARGQVTSRGKCVGHEAAGPAPGALLKPPRGTVFHLGQLFGK